jgi:DNA-binding transcriptional ArsR family regulator
MDQQQALAAFAALAQEHRLGIVRRLVRAGPDGLAAGLVAESVACSRNTVSFHLKELERAGLIRSRRESRSIIYNAAYPVLSELIQFLMRDCCEGHPEICAPAATALAACCETRTEVA